jgi:N-acylneuraminate cytidylyltransferase
MSVYVIVPARGGSKAIPGKNLRRVGGEPLVARAVRVALQADSVDRVVVSTDDDEIGEVARRAGAEVVGRPAELAGDDATSESALLHALDVLRDRGEPEPRITVMMQCTSPLTTPADVDGTVAVLDAEGADCAFTGARGHILLWHRGPDGAVAVNHDASSRPRRQDQTPDFVETGGVYAMRTAGFRAAGHRFFGRVGIFEVSSERALEIDELGDLELADALDARARRRHGVGQLPSAVAGLALDFDGVLTDNRVMTAQDGSEAVISNRSDGFGIEMLHKAGIPMIVISKETNTVVAARCRKLAVECVQGVEDKAELFSAWMKEHHLDAAGVVYVGNDVNDIDCLEIAGCGVAVADAHPDAIAAADLVLAQPGGRGAVRELAELIVSRRKGG